MKIDQMNLTQDLQSTVHNGKNLDQSRIEDRSNSQFVFNQQNEQNLLNMTLEKSQNTFFDAFYTNPEYTP